MTKLYKMSFTHIQWEQPKKGRFTIINFLITIRRSRKKFVQKGKKCELGNYLSIVYQSA